MRRRYLIKMSSSIARDSPVMVFIMADPVGSGIVGSLAHPSGNNLWRGHRQSEKFQTARRHRAGLEFCPA
jgi:hypothetical protein